MNVGDVEVVPHFGRNLRIGAFNINSFGATFVNDQKRVTSSSFNIYDIVQLSILIV